MKWKRKQQQRKKYWGSAESDPQNTTNTHKHTPIHTETRRCPCMRHTKSTLNCLEGRCETRAVRQSTAVAIRIEGATERERERGNEKEELEIAGIHLNTANVSKSLNGSKCYNGKILAKRQCRPWNMKLSFRTCTNFEYLDIAHINAKCFVLMVNRCGRFGMVSSMLPALFLSPSFDNSFRFSFYYGACGFCFG